MEKLVINGGKSLRGQVNISGAKNAAVAIIPAAILIKDVCRIENLPQIEDVRVILETLETMGAVVKIIDANTVEIDGTSINTYAPPDNLVQSMRASSYLMGVLVARFKRAKVAMPGGCNFGSRPIDQHIKGFTSMNVDCKIEGGYVYLETDKLVGASIYLDMASVGATINIMLAATLAQGVTVIENAAKEPHVVDLANFLNAVGAKVRGAGTDVIKITGVESLKGGSYSIIPDQIEAGTFMVAAAATNGDVTINGIIPKHLEAISAKLLEMGASIEEGDDTIRVFNKKPLTRVNVKTLEYPGFPTDMQPQIVALLSSVEGTSIATEGVWENRFQYTDELKRMGANIRVDGKVAVIEGVEYLTGSQVRATDLRGGVAMVIAGLIAKGNTEINDIRHIDRGYENLEEKFKALGADIRRIYVSESQ